MEPRSPTLASNGVGLLFPRGVAHTQATKHGAQLRTGENPRTGSLMRAFHEQEFHESSADFVADWCSKRSGYWLPELLPNHIITGYGDYGLVHAEVIDEPTLIGAGRER